MFDHVGFRIGNLEASRKFYLAALAPLGFGVAMEKGGGVGLGRGGKPELWLSRGGPPASPSISPSWREIALKSTLSTPPRSPPGDRTTAPRACAATIIRTITGRLQSTPTDTI